MALQGRFAHLSDADIEALSKAADEKWTRLLAKASVVEEV